jgi:hypothetical protein
MSKALDFLHSHVNYDGDGCLTWPFARVPAGYGNFKCGDKGGYAHRYMCKLVNGPPPTPKHEAAHSCGRGHLACVDPRHLSWKTRSENQKDRTRHGRANRGTGRAGPRKLTPSQVLEIRSLYGNVTNADLAARFNVSRGTIRKIHLNEVYRG